MAHEHTLAAGAGPSRIQIWIEATRPFSFTASITPVLIGSVVGAADGPFSLARFFLALFGSLFIHIGTNLINDAYDYVNGVDTRETLGPGQVVQRGLRTAEEV